MSELDFVDYELFDGGMSDIDTPNDRRTAEVVENFDVTNVKKLKQRPGSQILDPQASLVSTSAGGVRENGQTGSLINYEDDLHLIIRSKSSLYAKNLASWTAGITTSDYPWTKIPAVNSGWDALPSFKSLTAASVISAAPWQGHEILVGKDESNGAYVSPQKVYLDDATTFKARNAWLPAPANPAGFVTYSAVLTHAIALANALKSGLNTHMADTDAHPAATAGAPYVSTAISAADATDEISLCKLTAEIVSRYNDHVNLESNTSGYNTHGLSSIMVSFGYTAEKVTAGLNYRVSESPKPDTAYEAARILNQLLWTVNLHFVSILEGDATLANTLWPINTVVLFDTAGDTAQFTGADYYRVGDTIRFNGGTLPTPLVAGTTYYAIRSISGYIKLATSLANAKSGTAIDLGGVPAGNTYVVRDATNFHPKVSDPVALATSYPKYCYPEGFVLSASETLGYPHISLDFKTDAITYVAGMRAHFVNLSQHSSVNSGFLYYQNDQTLVGGSSGSTSAVLDTDWKIYAGVVKAYAAYRVHRIESAGFIHPSGFADEAAGSDLAYNKMQYMSKYAPNPFDTTTWTPIVTILGDGVAKFNIHTVKTTRHTNAGSTLATPVTEVMSQRRYALVAKNIYKNYRNLTFEAISAPSYSDSYAFMQINKTSNFSPSKYVVYIQGPRSLVPLPAVPAIENYDTANVTIEIYRTLDAGSIFYFATSLSNTDALAATTIGYVDVVDDDTVEANDIELYTTGGVIAYDEAPRAKSVARVGNYAAYGGIVEESSPTVAAATLTGGTPGTVNMTAHGYSAGDAITFWGLGTGSVTGITDGTIYYVSSVGLAANTLQVSTTPANAVAGTNIAITVGGAPSQLYAAKQKLIELKNRVRQSVPAIAFSSPASFYTDLESDVLQVGRAQENFVAVCKQGIYRIEGRFDEQGQGGTIAKNISERVGGVSALGGITVNDLFYFMGNDGFYVTDGYKVDPISVQLKIAHTNIAQQNSADYSAQNNLVQCSYDRLNNRILWSVDEGATGTANANWVLHLNHVVDGKASFTKWNNSTYFAPTAMGYFRGSVLRGDSQGFVFSHLSTLNNDPYIDRAAASSLGALVALRSIHIPLKYRSLPEDFGNRGARKWIIRALLQWTNTATNLTLALKSINDKAISLATAMKGIRYRGEYGGLIKERRTFPASSTGTGLQGLRAHTKQLQVEADTTAILYGSDDYALITIAGSIATLASGNWPTPSGSLLGMNIYLDTDSYVTAYPITAVSTNTLTATALPTGSAKKWLIKGAPRDEQAELLAYTMYFGQVAAQPTPPSGDSGGNA